MRGFRVLARTAFAVSLAVSLFSPRVAQAVEPGVDIAVPRVAISNTADNFVFSPASLVVEQGDYVRWRFIGTTYIHTTTSGSSCTYNGIWTATLSATSPSWTQQFSGLPGPNPYFCGYHCYFYGMVGQVTETTVIDVTGTDTAGILTLTWVGGRGPYRVFRSDNPAFTGTGTVILTPSGGTTATTLSDILELPPGMAAFYLVMNQF